MIQFDPNKIVRVELTPKEHKTILKHCLSLDRDIYGRIANAKDGVLHLLIEDCHRLRECVRFEMDNAKKPKVQNILGNVFNKISPNTATRRLAEEIEGKDFDSIDDLNDHLQGIMTGRNKAPDPEMGGLSPEEVSRLIYLQWDDNNFPLKFSKDLTFSDVKGSTFFTNATIFLKALIEMEKDPTATAKGNLNRKIVKILFDKFILDEDYKRFTLEYNKVINEEDVFPLHIIRTVCEVAGLVHKIKNKFLVIKKYQYLISEEKAGELYHLLFNSYFTKLNIGYIDRLPELESIQQTVEYSFYMLREIANRYISIEDLVDKIFLPAVRNKIRAEISEHMRIEWVLTSRIIRPLEGFGLLECSYRKKTWRNEIEKVRKTELFDKFVGYEW